MEASFVHSFIHSFTPKYLMQIFHGSDPVLSVGDTAEVNKLCSRGAYILVWEVNEQINGQMISMARAMNTKAG